jgi:hypothetical protein
MVGSTKIHASLRINRINGAFEDFSISFQTKILGRLPLAAGGGYHSPGEVSVEATSGRCAGKPMPALPRRE